MMSCVLYIAIGSRHNMAELSGLSKGIVLDTLHYLGTI